MAVTVVLAGGGTGGHVFPALALAEAIRKEDARANVRFIGTEQGLENRLVRQAGYVLDVVPARPVIGRGLLGALRGLLTLTIGVFRARRRLQEIRPSLVIGVGGYASIPGVVAAATLGVPTALLEPDARPGLANRALARLSRIVFVQFEEAVAQFPSGKARRVGLPVRSMPRSTEPPDPSGALRLLVLGGSQGAHSINRAICSSLDQLGERDGFRITHQTGERDLTEVREAYQRAGIDAVVVAFLDDLPERLTRAGLVVARAGAATVSELCAAGVPSILLPYPHAASDHQMANARSLEREGACVVVPDAEADRRLASEIRTLAQDAERRRRMAEAARRQATPDAAEQIWRTCAAWIPSAGGGWR
jgi:UDP-N-acetylglucosamine--N-acetylmuramyl-(pentapeptide) pyrophosphoryl-undecaprenol N-acetylglucosamine transferase